MIGSQYLINSFVIFITTFFTLIKNIEIKLFNPKIININ